MAATGYTPIQLYYSTTPSAQPVNTNLVDGELAINTNDGKLFYKDSGGTVQTIASKGTGSIGGSTTQVQYNNAGALAGSANMTFDGSRLSVSGVEVGRGGAAVASNTAIGSGALQSNTLSGINNTVVGFQAASSNTTGDNIVGIGYQALYSNTAGNDSIAIGVNANRSNTAAHRDTAIGTNALQNNTTNFAYATAVGWSAMGQGSNVYNCDAFGVESLYSVNGGTQNVGFGQATLFTLTTGNNNTALGFAAGYNISTGSDNTAVGNYSQYYLGSASTGSRNTSVGGESLYTAGNKSDNTAIGYRSLYLIGTANQNTAVGAESLYSNTATGNSAVGYRAAYSNTFGANNAAFGYQSLYNTTTGSLNTAIGYLSLSENITNGSNTAVGNLSAGRMRASENTAVGESAMIGSITPANNTGQQNVAIGKNALRNITSGSTNTVVGYASGLEITTGAKNTIIGSYSGNQGGLDIRTANNYIVLSDGDGNPRAYWNGADATIGGNSAFVTTTATPAQDGVIVTGRAGGTSTYRVTIQPTTLTASRTLTLPDATTTVVGTDATQTLTNKRIDPRVTTPGATSGNFTANGDTTDVFDCFGLTGAITFLTPSGTPVNGQRLMIRIEDNGSARGITWTTSSGAFRAVGVTLPSTTTASKIIYVGCVYNSTDIFWDVVAVATQA